MSTTTEKVQGAIGDTVHQATDLAGAVGEKAHGVAAAIAECAGHAKESVRQVASHTAESVAHAKDKVVNWAADAAHHPGEYLKAGGNELTSLIRRYPIPAILVGVGIGFLLARVTRGTPVTPV